VEMLFFKENFKNGEMYKRQSDKRADVVTRVETLTRELNNIVTNAAYLWPCVKATL
jgi:hypothetical protein